MNMHVAPVSGDRFSDWVTLHLGTNKWIVARRNKQRVEQGYELFLTQRRFAALRAYFSKEIGEMEVDSVSQHLSEPDLAFAQRRKETSPGQAFWSGTGPEGKTCRTCARWEADGYMAGSGLLKDSLCAKYRSLMNGQAGARVPHYAKACKYFEQGDERSIHQPKKLIAG